jgi:heme/copper-type cytochrome/quinol oxidase subunit 2
MIFTVIAYLLIAALAIVVLGVLFLPVYLCVRHRDSMRARQRTAELTEINALLAETDALLDQTRSAQRPAPIP